MQATGFSLSPGRPEGRPLRRYESCSRRHTSRFITPPRSSPRRGRASVRPLTRRNCH